MSEKLKTVRLYGKLGARFGRVHQLAVGSAAEAMRALCVMVPGFETYMREAPQSYAVFAGRDNLAVEQLGHPTGRADIRIAPVPAGAKSGGLFAVIIGVVLIAVGFFVVGGSIGLAMSIAGAGMALSGALMMLAPQTSGDMGSYDGPNNRASYAFNGPVNTVAQGNPVPILYGELIVGSCVISGGIFSEERS